MKGIVLAAITVTTWVLGIRHFGGMQSLEVVVFDWMMRSRPDSGVDDRLLVVEINEVDIAQLQQWPPSDRVLAQLLQQLQQHQPQAIGLDLVRDRPNPPGYEELVAQLQQPNVIAVTSIGNINQRDRVAAPPSIPETQVGFNDLPIDPDGRVRRNLMFASNDETTLTSFSLQLALIYLGNQGIYEQLTEANEYQLGQKVFAKLQKNSGGYQAIDSRGYQILLNYRTSGSIARKISITQVLQGDFEPEWVRDKIVLIGATAPTLKDLFFTPYSVAEHGKQMPGVLVHAHMTSQIINAVLEEQPLFWFWSEWGEYLWILAWATGGVIVVFYVQNPLALGGSIIALLGVLIGMSYGLFTQAGWVPVATPALAFMLATTAGILNKVQLSWQQQQMVMKLLGQQTSPEIANALWNSRDRLVQSGMLPAQTLTATILFSDLKNFSTLAEKKSPEELMAWLNPYLSAMTEEVLNHNGIVNKFTGDGIMAVFGVPVARTTPEEIAQDAQNAVNCALVMGACLQKFNQKWQQQGLPEVGMRIGIFTGSVTVGSLGGKHRLEYGVIGDSVNVASRLESCEKKRQPDLCRILIARETLEYLQEDFQVESWGELILKGRANPVEVYRVIRRNS
ncbi:adenylate/guanylate cyclase domain-containing protein [Geitlerinema splendidum]|nr:adenylate/guanylate cyclase domain-containing protein [Geitlerinema splendidum]